MKIDHVCWWTRRRESEISEDETYLFGAGVPGEVLDRAAQLLGTRLVRIADPESEYDEAIRLVDVASGWIHDGCMFRLEPVSPSLKNALLQALLELHGSYLDSSIDPSEVLPALRDLLGPGRIVRLRSNVRLHRLEVRSYPISSGFFDRLRSRPVYFSAS